MRVGTSTRETVGTKESHQATRETVGTKESHQATRETVGTKEGHQARPWENQTTGCFRMTTMTSTGVTKTETTTLGAGGWALEEGHPHQVGTA